MSRLRLPHLTSISELSAEQAMALLSTAERCLLLGRQPVRHAPSLRGKTVVNLFYEASTRTRTSFEIAAKRLGADVVNISPSTSSATKGETLADTVANIDAMHADVIVLRHPASGAAQYLARHPRLSASIVNAGDGMHEHPSQALLDALAIRRAKGRIEGLTVAICGDIAHSRVARSNALLLRALGAKLRLAGPRTLLPAAAEALGAPIYDRIEPAIEGADVVMMLRIQQERIGGAAFSTLREYAQRVRPQPHAPRTRRARRDRDAPGADQPRRRALRRRGRR
jgi:aspartate carbamoyltransferase catalytic subunit